MSDCPHCAFDDCDHIALKREQAMARDLSEAIRLLREVDRVSRVAVVCPECHAADVEHLRGCALAALLAKYPETT